jgi:hypothetical protein
MPDEQLPAAGGARGPAAPLRPPFHLRVPDVFAEQKSAPSADALPAPPPRDPIAEARAKLSEKRILEGQQQVTSLIAGARDRRRRLFGRLWAASILLTALSVVALAVEIVERMDFLNPVTDTAQSDQHNVPENPRRAPATAPARRLEPKSEAPREWSNQLPQQDSVKSAVYETARPGSRDGAWLPGTISDNDTDNPRRGDLHDDHPSRAD